METQPDESKQPTGPTETENILYIALNPDALALEGLDIIMLIDPNEPEKGFRLKSEDELSPLPPEYYGD